MSVRIEDRLLDLARDSIRYGLEVGSPKLVHPDDLPEEMRQPGAAFVTLKKDGELRGCIGSPMAWRPLAVDVADNAFKSAFEDPRFPPLREDEMEGLEISVSVLTPPVPVHFKDENDLLSQLRPGVDGLILEDNGRRGLFLPQVWEALPEPREFLRYLKVKAGLPVDHWSASIKVQRFEALEIKP
jgi:AmmeMemoRadiSam system protein A